MEKGNSLLRTWVVVALFFIVNGLPNGWTKTRGASESFNFKKFLFGQPSTLEIFVQTMDASTGLVTINGGDSRSPSIPFSFDWGDGAKTDGWFPQNHTYTDKTKNYIVAVTSHYSDGSTDQVKAVVFFTSPFITPIDLPSDISVMIPLQLSAPLQSRIYDVPANLACFDDGFFSTIPRSVIEYALTASARIQEDFANDDLFLFDGKFEQLLLRDATSNGMYSLWYTSPVSFGVGDYGFRGTVQWSSFLHEMGHNFSLNSPARYYCGGKIDGNANAIYSESMAQIFAHAAAYELINQAGAYGLSEDLAVDIKQSAISSIKIIRNSYENYLSSDKPFSSWNNPSTSSDETFDTFMTIAYEFFKHAENDGMGYRLPLKRMMALLQTFDASLAAQYDQNHNTAAAATFRSTLMVSALSYAFSRDLRQEFRDLNFPIDDACYLDLYQRVPPLLTITSPNGGEIWNVGSTHDITWTTPEKIAETKIEYSTNGGTDWTTVTESAPGATSGIQSFSWTIPDEISATCLIRVSEGSTGAPIDTSDAVFTISKGQPIIELSKTSFYFASVQKGKTSLPDSVLITNSGDGTLQWTAASSAAWLTAAPKTGSSGKTMKIKIVNAGKMSVGTYTGTITITDPDAANSPATIQVTLIVKAAGKDAVPFGEFDTPANGATIHSATTAASGWALDDVGAKSVKIYRKVTETKKALVGTAKFIIGTRPDIEASYPAYPLNNRAGWSFNLKMSKLPNKGVGTFVLMAYVQDLGGHKVLLGTHTITGVAPTTIQSKSRSPE